MNLLNLAKKRYSCRSFFDKPIDKELMMNILEAGRVAPSAANKQPWTFIVVNEHPLLQQIKSCYGKSWIESAPAVIVMCGNHANSWKRDDGKDHCDMDIAIATDHIALAASDAGLGTCWVCKFDAVKCASILGLPPEIEPMVLLPIGFPSDTGNPNRHDTQRLPPDRIIKWNKW